VRKRERKNPLVRLQKQATARQQCTPEQDEVKWLSQTGVAVEKVSDLALEACGGGTV